MALYIGNQKIAGGGGSRNANIVSCDSYDDYVAKRDANIRAGKLSVSYYTPDDGSISPVALSDYAVLTGGNHISGSNDISVLNIMQTLSATNNFSEEDSLEDKSLIMTDETGSYNVNYSQLCQQLYPIGSIYTTINANFDPNTSFGGTWQKIASGKCLFGADNIHLAGNEIQAGLPNVQAQVSINNLSTSIGGSHSHKILKADLTTGSIVDPGKGLGISQTKIDSSVYNGHVHTINGTGTITIENTGLYGMSDTVQPPAIAVIFWQRTA